MNLGLLGDKFFGVRVLKGRCCPSTSPRGSVKDRERKTPACLQVRCARLTETRRGIGVHTLATNRPHRISSAFLRAFRRIGILWLVIGFGPIGAESWSAQASGAAVVQPNAAADESSNSAAGGLQALYDREHDLEEEHESNGPEGSRGVPMQRLSLTGVILALLVLSGGAGLATLAERKKSAGS